MNVVTQKAKKRQRIIEYSLKHGKSEASRKYKEPLSNIKRWSKRYDGTWQSLKDKSGQPHSHPKQHTLYEESLILFQQLFYMGQSLILCKPQNWLQNDNII